VSRWSLVARGWLLSWALDRIAAPHRRRLPRRKARSARRADPRRSPLLPLAFGAFALGLPIMVIFHHWATLLVGVLLMLTFIVAGVFLVASPTFLEQEDE